MRAEKDVLNQEEEEGLEVLTSLVFLFVSNNDRRIIVGVQSLIEFDTVLSHQDLVVLLFETLKEVIKS